jgi:hypothetical protein
LLRGCPIPDAEILGNLALFLNRSSLSQVLFLEYLYREILPIHGVILEFGVRWGRNLATLITLRTLLEPYNFCRQIVGFDAFEGFPSVSDVDGKDPVIAPKSLCVSRGYEDYLNALLESHEALGVRSHVKRFELCKGDAAATVPGYFSDHPESVVALAYFDFDLYTPTLKCLEIITPFLTKGSIIAFDEACHPAFPRETVALHEAGILQCCSLQRLTYSGFGCYARVE